MAWGNKYLAEHGLIPKEPLQTNPEKTKVSYHAETGHQVYMPTKDSLDAVQQQGSSIFAKDISKEGSVLRDDTSNYIEKSKDHIEERSESVVQKGSKTETKVKTQQGRYVTKRVADKVVKEGMETYEDVKKWWNGESQQK